MKTHTWVLILLTAASAVLLINLGEGSLSSWDEAFYAQVSREMFENNNWVDLTWAGVPWCDKPPLYMWGTAIFYNIFGVNEFSARLFSALAGILTVIFTYLFATKVFSKKIGVLSAFMLMSTYHFVWFSKSGTLDITFTLFALLSFYFFSLSEEKRSNVIYSFICFSLAFLTKGIAALLIPMALGSYVLMRKERSLILNRYVLIGGIVSLTIIGSWYMPAYFHYGPAFLKGHFFQHFVERTVGSMDGHSGDWLTYINAILYKGKPWGVVGLISFPFFIFFAIKKKEFHKYPFISWIVVTYVIFTLVKTKLHWYIMPIYPALAIVAAWGVGKVLKKYAIFVVAICSLASVVYFGISKDIFTLDFNPEVKGFSYEVEKGIFENDKVYLYEIGDPGIRFYCGGFSENIYSKEELLDKQSENTIIIAKSGTLDNMRIYGEIIAVGPNRVRAVRVVKNNEG